MLRKTCIALSLLLAVPAWAQTEAPAVVADTARTVLVVGQRPGPGMWKISKGDNVLWVFATYSPLPVKMQWRSQQVEAIISQSQLYLSPPTLGASVGVWGGLKMLPHVVGMRKNPGGAMLRDVVPPEVYARWRVLKAKYGISDDAESERPVFVAETLYRAGLQHAGLATSDEVSKSIQALLTKNQIKVMHSHVQLDVPNPGKTLKQFKQGSMEDAACFKATIERLETDIEVMRKRANAWAKGDLDEIRKLSFADREAACQSAMASSPALRDGMGLEGAEKRVRKLWLEAAEHALANYKTSFAMLKLGNVLRSDYVMTDLAAKGYTVQAPD
ncbi:MAG: TraB/GumN family protein [Telluria sp.]